MADDIIPHNSETSVMPPTWLYVIGPVERLCPVKIGISYCVERRQRTLQLSSPLVLTEHFRLFCGDRTEEMEKAVHRRLKHLRCHGEWFDVVPVRAVEIIEEIWRDYLQPPELPDVVGREFRHRVTNAVVRAIRADERPVAVIAAEYGMTARLAGAIRSREEYTHVREAHPAEPVAKRVLVPGRIRS